MSNNQKGKPKKQEITLMTILAYEATSGSRKLLKKYGREDAKNFVDLENKLAQLYYSVDDKVTLEKELADLHPHKNWLLKTITPDPVIEQKKEVVIEAAPVVEQKQSGCNCGGNCPCKQSSSFDGTGSQPKQTTESNQFEKYFGMIALVGVVGIAFYALNKSK